MCVVEVEVTIRFIGESQQSVWNLCAVDKHFVSSVKQSSGNADSTETDACFTCNVKAYACNVEAWFLGVYLYANQEIRHCGIGNNINIIV